MDVYARNEYLCKHGYLIKAVVRQNMCLLKALRMDLDDVYQELAIAMLRAVEGFDPRRSDSLDTHVCAKLNYAILDIKRAHRPFGMTGLRGSRVTVDSVERFYDDDMAMDIHGKDAFDEVEVADILAILTPAEKIALRQRMDGYTNCSRNQSDMLESAREKIRDLYQRDDLYASCY